MVETEKELCLCIGGPLDNKWLEIGRPVKVCKYPIMCNEKIHHHDEYSGRTEIGYMIYNEEHYLESGDRYRVFVLEGYDRTKAR
jgi:hypothetical protein